MNTINKNNYYVVQFKDLPYDNIRKYVIIPYSWIRGCKSSGIIQVAFPKEDPKKTRERVKKNEKYGQNWQLYEAIVKFDSNNFKDADIWGCTTKTENSLNDSKNDAVAANNNALTTNKDATKEAKKYILQLPKKRYRNIDVEKTFSTSEVNKPEMKIKPLKSDKTELIKKILKRKMGSDSRTEFMEKKANIANSVKSTGDCLSHLIIPSGNLTDNKVSSNAEYSDKKRYPKNMVVNLVTTKNTKSDDSPPQSCMTPENLSQLRVSVNLASNFFQNHENAHSEKRIDSSVAMKDVRKLKLQISSRSNHHSSESKSPIVNDESSHEEPQRLSPPSINNPQFTVQKDPVLMNQHYQVSERSSEKLYPKTFDGQQQHQQRHSPTRIPLSQSVIQKTPRSGEDHRENPRSTTFPMQCYPKIEDQTSRRSPELQTVLPNYLYEVPLSQRFLSAESSERIPFNEVTKNTPPPVQDLPNQSKTSPNCKPIVRGLLLQDPMTGRLFLRKLNTVLFPKKVTIQDTTVNSSSSEQNIPPSECKYASSYTDYILPEESVEKCIPEKPTITDSSVSKSQNILSRQTNPITHCKCVVEKRTSSLTPNQSCEPVSKKQFSDASDNSSDQETLTKELPVEKLNYPNHDKSSNGSERNSQCVLTKENNSPITIKTTIDSKEMAEQILINEFDLIFNKIHTTVNNRYAAPFTVRNELHDYVQTFQNIITNVNNFSELRIKELKSNKEPQTTPAVSSSPEDTTVTRGNNQQNGNNDNYDEEATKIMKKPRLFILPPDYDPNDTRWTLKYREPGPKIIELIPHSNIYIKAYKLAYCKRVARDCKTLARMLLIEIFSLSALSVCSLTGARAKAFDLVGSDVRPGLDEHARSVLLMFVEEYGIKNRWCVFDTQSILNSIRSKIQEIRSKHGSRVQ